MTQFTNMSIEKFILINNQKQICLSTKTNSPPPTYGVVADAYMDLESSAQSISFRNSVYSFRLRDDYWTVDLRCSFWVQHACALRTRSACNQPTTFRYSAQNSCCRELSFSAIDIKKRFHFAMITFADFFITLRICYAATYSERCDQVMETAW